MEEKAAHPGQLIGCPEHHPKLALFLQDIQGTSRPPKPPLKEYFAGLKSRPPCVYHNFKDFGLSLCFENSVLQGVHLYNGTHGYSFYRGPLPYGLRMQMQGADIVKLLGEPDVKMGGGRGGPISLAYKGKGLQFNFVGNDWEDMANVLDSVTVHEPE